MFYYRHNNFYAPVTTSQRDWRQRKQIINKETDTTAIMLYSLKKDRAWETKRQKAQIKIIKKLWDYTHPLSPHPYESATPPPPQLSHSPIIHKNNTMDAEFLFESNLRSFGYFKCSSRPQLQSQLACKSWLCALQVQIFTWLPKWGISEKWKLRSNPRYNPAFVLSSCLKELLESV